MYVWENWADMGVMYIVYKDSWIKTISKWNGFTEKEAGKAMRSGGENWPQEAELYKGDDKR